VLSGSGKEGMQALQQASGCLGMSQYPNILDIRAYLGIEACFVGYLCPALQVLA
jgi:hypothetical protein